MYIRVMAKHWGCRLGENTSKKEMEERAGGEVTNHGMVLYMYVGFDSKCAPKMEEKKLLPRVTCVKQQANYTLLHQ